MGWNWAKENWKRTPGTFSEDWDQWSCGMKTPGEVVGALLLQSVQTRLDQIFEYNPTLAESKSAMAGRWKKWPNRSFPSLISMSHPMYAVVRHTAGQTWVICYTFQPQNPQILTVPQLNDYLSRGWGLPGDFWCVYNQLNIRKEGRHQSGVEGGE